MKEETNFIDELIAEAETNEEKQTLAYFDLIIMEIARLEVEISENFNNADDEARIIKEWVIAHNSKLQEKVDYLKLKLEAFIREIGKKTIDLPHGTLKIRKMPDKVEIADMDTFLQNANSEVVTIVPETIKPDLSKIKTYIRNSGRPLPGVIIVEGLEQFKLTINHKTKRYKMTQRNKLEIPINQPITVELLFDEPISGMSRYGTYNMYAVEVDGEQYSFFPTAEVHEKLKDLRKGDRAVIIKLAAQRGSKLVTVYEVKPEIKVIQQQSNTVTMSANNVVDVSDIKEESSIEEETENIPPADDFYQIMLHCYRDAQKIQHELNGFGDAEKIAVTLFIARSKHNSY